MVFELRGEYKKEKIPNLVLLQPGEYNYKKLSNEKD